MWISRHMMDDCGYVQINYGFIGGEFVYSGICQAGRLGGKVKIIFLEGMTVYERTSSTITKHFSFGNLRKESTKLEPP